MVSGRQISGLAPTLPFGAIERLRTDKSVFLECKDNLTFMRSLADASMKLIVTSPPYNIGKSYERRAPLDQYVQQQTAVIAECVRLLHPQGSICWQVGNHVSGGEIVPLDVPLYPIFKNHGLRLRNRIVWHFEHGLHCSKRLSGRYETINWFTRSDDYTFNLDPIRVPSKYPGNRYFKGPNAGNFRAIPAGKILATCGSFQTSRTIISRKPPILANSRLS